jgi:hypothetical protein
MLEIATVAGLFELTRHLVVQVSEHVLSQVAHDKYRELEQHIRERIPGLAALPTNHDVAHAVRTAQLKALDLVVADYGRSGHATPLSQQIRKFVRERLRLFGRIDVHHPQVRASVASGADAMLDALAMTSAAKMEASDLRRRAEDGLLEEIRQALSEELRSAIPSDFVAWYRGERGNTGWFDAYSQYLAEEVKTNERFRAIFHTDLLGDLTRMGLDTNKTVHAMDKEIDKIAGQLEMLADTLNHAVITLNAIVRHLGLDPQKIAVQTGISLAKLRDIVNKFGIVPEGELDPSAIAEILSKKADELQKLKDELDRLKVYERPAPPRGDAKPQNEDARYVTEQQYYAMADVLKVNASSWLNQIAHQSAWLISDTHDAWAASTANLDSLIYREFGLAEPGQALLQRAKGGDLEAQHDIAYDYAGRAWMLQALGEKSGRPPNARRIERRYWREAIKWYQKAAEGGHKKAIAVLREVERRRSGHFV